MTTEILSQAIEEAERYRLTNLAPAIAKALAVMRALKYLLEGPPRRRRRTSLGRPGRVDAGRRARLAAGPLHLGAQRRPGMKTIAKIIDLFGGLDWLREPGNF